MYIYSSDILLTLVTKNITDNTILYISILEPLNPMEALLENIINFNTKSQLLECLSKLEELGMNFSITKAIDNINKFPSTNFIQLVIVFTAIDFDYSLFFITMELPIKLVCNLKKLDF